MDVALAIGILLLLAVVAGWLDLVPERELVGRAVVSDGDSLRIAGQRVRLAGIDAPELAQACRRLGEDYACGREAAARLGDMIAGTVVTCRGWRPDRYGRLLARCTAGGTLLNRQMVSTGWAVSYHDHADAERLARSAGLGLWAGEFERPEDWRRNHANAREEVRLIGILDWLRALFER